MDQTTGISMQSVVKATREVLWRPLGKEVAILNLRNSTYYGLDPVGAYLWTLMQQATSMRELRDAMLEKYDLDQQRCEQELLDLLHKLHSEGLVEVQGLSARLTVF
jgi:hypothetical protein